MAELFKKNTIKHMTTVSSEYEQTLTDQHKAIKWGGTAFKWAGEDVKKLLGKRSYALETALDYGCGQEAMKANFPELKWHGYDPGIPEKAEKPTGQFDLVVCNDVMEHVEREHVEAVLQEIADYAKTVVLLNIACTAAHGVFTSGPRVGQDVHITQRPPEWWAEKVAAIDGIVMLERHDIATLRRGEWRTRVKIIFEKL
jgi:hypothetical protein